MSERAPRSTRIQSSAKNRWTALEARDFGRGDRRLSIALVARTNSADMSVEMGDILFLSPTTRHEGGIIVPRKEDVMKNLRFARKWVLIALSGTFLAMGLATLMQGEA